MLNVNVKWGKQKYTVELNTNEPPLVFKSQLYALTGVLPERQKVMGVKGGVLKDDADWASLGIKEGHPFMLMGSAEEIPKAPEKATVFVEDLSEEQAGNLVQALYPPGLANLGNTCYMNATLQCFRKVPELTAALKAYSGTVSNDDNAASVSAALRDLFVVMDVSNQPATPLTFLTVMRKAFPQFAQQDHGHYMQQDADECWGQLLIALSQKIPRAPGAIDAPPQVSSSSSSSAKLSAISDLFHGVKQTTQKCLDNDDPPTTKSELLEKLSCHISNTTSFLINGLKEGLETSVTLNNDAGQPLKYTQTSRISKLPYYLTVQFVRFYWRADKKAKAKIVRPVEFPLILDVHDLCTPELQKELAPHRRAFEEQEELRLQRERERAKRKAEDPTAPDQTKEQAAAESATDDPMQVSSTKPEKPYVNDTGKYELAAVLTHKGREAESGHYVAWVKQTGDKWLKYDDDKVSEVRYEDIKKLDGHGGGDWHIAYMCLYRTYNP